jgi:hypothetical protein
MCSMHVQGCAQRFVARCHAQYGCEVSCWLRTPSLHHLRACVNRINVLEEAQNTIGYARGCVMLWTQHVRNEEGARAGSKLAVRLCTACYNIACTAHGAAWQRQHAGSTRAGCGEARQQCFVCSESAIGVAWCKILISYRRLGAQVGLRLSSSAKPAVQFGYRAIGSAMGRQELMLGLQNGSTSSTARPAYVVTGSYPHSSNYSALQAAGGALTIPLFAARIGLWHSVWPADENDKALVPLNLSACTLAKIYGGQITSWTHAEITRDNPGLPSLINSTGSARITVLRHASSGSSAVAAITAALHA